MKLLPALAAFALLTACSTTTTTHKVTTYDQEGREISTVTSTTTRNDTAERAKQLGHNVKEGVVDGYEWTKEKTVNGYHWVKNKSERVYDAVKN